MRKVLAVIVIGAFALSMLWVGGTLLQTQVVPPTHPPPPSPSLAMRILSIGNSSLSVEIAETEELWKRGLSGREALPENSGMLFVFSEPKAQVFWMKNTRIPLDILWVHDGRVVGIQTMQPEPNVPDDQLHRYASPEPVEWVVEVNAGWAADHGVQIGDSVTLAS